MLGKVMVAAAKPLVDEPEVPRRRQHVAEGPEGLGRQGLGMQRAAHRAKPPGPRSFAWRFTSL